MNRATLVRFLEAFATVFLVSVAATISLAGESGIDLSTADGRSRLLTAVISAAILALRRALATSGSGGQ